MINWRKYRLGDIVEDIAMGPFGSNLKVDNFINSGVPVIRGSNLNKGGFQENNFVFVSEEKAKTLKRCITYPDELVFTHRGTIGQVGIIPNNQYPYYLVSQSQMRLAVNKQYLIPKFLYYFFLSPFGQRELLKNASQVGVPAIATPTKSLKEVSVLVPPLEEQSRIASILSSLDDKIELNLRMNKTLEAIAQAIFKEWFVDFRFPGFDGELVDGLPKGWRRGKLGDGFKLVMGQSPPGESYNEIGNGTAFYQGRTDFGFRFPENRMYTTVPMRMAKKLDTLVSVRAPVGDINMAMEECCIGRGLSAIRHSSGAYSYTYYGMKHIENIFKGFEGEGTVFGSINKTNFENISMILPDSIVVGKFEKFVNPIDEKILNNSCEIKTLTEIRDLLLPKLMTGKIKVW